MIRDHKMILVDPGKLAFKISNGFKTFKRFSTFQQISVENIYFRKRYSIFQRANDYLNVDSKRSLLPSKWPWTHLWIREYLTPAVNHQRGFRPDTRRAYFQFSIWFCMCYNCFYTFSYVSHIFVKENMFKWSILFIAHKNSSGPENNIIRRREACIYVLSILKFSIFLVFIILGGKGRLRRKKNYFCIFPEGAALQT